MPSPNTTGRRQGAAPPFDLQRLREIRKQAEQAHAERQRRMDEVERLLRCHEEPPEDLFNCWARECASEGLDPVRRLDYLTRPLEKRCADLFSEYPEGWTSHEKPPDKLLAPYLKQWGALDDPKRRPVIAELLTYLEDARNEWAQHQAQVLGPAWAGFEWERGEAVVSALRVVVREALDYVEHLTGDNPVMDPRLFGTPPLLLKLHSRLLKTIQSARERPWRKDLPRKSGRPRTGVDKNWAAQVVGEARTRLKRIHQYDKYREGRAEYIRDMDSLARKIVARLGILQIGDVGSETTCESQARRPHSEPGGLGAGPLAEEAGEQGRVRWADAGGRLIHRAVACGGCVRLGPDRVFGQSVAASGGTPRVQGKPERALEPTSPLTRVTGNRLAPPTAFRPPCGGN